MVAEEKLRMLGVLTGETDEAILLIYLSIAESIVLNRVYPPGQSGEMPDRYSFNQIRIAEYLMNKRGAEGETSHSENGISRSYESGDVPMSLLRDIIPGAKIIGYVEEEPAPEPDGEGEVIP